MLLIDSFHTPEEVMITRKVAGQGKVDFTGPLAFMSFNLNMGGNDSGDSLRSRITTHQKSKKWWRALFFYVIDLAIVATFKIIKNTDNKGKRYTTRVAATKIVEQILYPVQIQKKKRKVYSVNEFFHLPEESEKYKRCVKCSAENKRKETKLFCPDCQVGLCVSCYATYHSLLNQ